MGIIEPFYCLGFNYHLFVYHEIDDVCIRNAKSFIGDVQMDFQLHLVVLKSEGMSQTNLVHILQQAWTQRPLHFDRSANNGLCKFHMRMALATIFIPMLSHPMLPPERCI